MIVLELFAGTRSISKAFEKRGHKTFSIEWSKDFENISLYADISKVTTKDIIKLCGGVPDVIWASPDCTTYSIAAISHHREYNDGVLTPLSEYAKFCDKTNKHVLNLIQELKPKYYFIENPRGGFRKMDFVNEKEDRQLQTVTCPLLIKADGEKMGKTSSGTLWVSGDKTTVYDFYQMFINSYDEDVERLLSFFSDYEIAEIKKMCRDDIREAKKIMAFEVTKLVHGEEEALKVKKISEEIFNNSGNSENTASVEVNSDEFKEEVNIIDLLMLSLMFDSKSEARRLIQQGGIKVNNEKITDLNKTFTLKDFVDGEYILIQKGKKNFKKIVLSK